MALVRKWTRHAVQWSCNDAYDVVFTAGFDGGAADVFSVVFCETPTDPATDAGIGLQYSAVAPTSDVASDAEQHVKCALPPSSPFWSDSVNW